MIYVFPSGSPQPADVVFLAAVVLILLPAIRAIFRRRQHALVLLAAWIMVVNAAWFLVLAEGAFLRSSLYYVFNVLVFAAFAYAYAAWPSQFTRVVRVAVIAAVGVQLLVVVSVDPSLRHAGTFNHPNQLGYWSVLLAAVYGVVMREARIGPVDVFVFGAAAYACVLSNSQAALVGMVLIVGVFLIAHPARPGTRVAFAGLAVALLIVAVVEGSIPHYLRELPQIAAVEERIELLLERDDEAAHRGWDRIGEHPEHILIGAGEGGYERFSVEELELHSSYGTLLFSYGVAGLVLFGVVLMQALRGAPPLVVAYFVPVLLYGVVHQGLRFSLFWVLLAVVASTSRRWGPGVREGTRPAQDEQHPRCSDTSRSLWPHLAGPDQALERGRQHWKYDRRTLSPDPRRPEC